MSTMHSVNEPALSDGTSSDWAKFIMHEDQNLHHGNFMEGLWDSSFSACPDELSPDALCNLGQHKHVCYNEGTGIESLSENWEDWINKGSEPQACSNMVFNSAPASACTLPTSLHDFLSQTSSNSQPTNTNYPSCTARAINTSMVQPSELPFGASPYAPKELDLHHYCTNIGLGNNTDSIMAPYPSLLEMNLKAALGPLLFINEKEPTVHQPLSCLKPKVSSDKTKPAAARAIRGFRTKRVRKNEKAETVLVESTTDGYRWCKYGQKILKKTMHPRGYFRCAHPNCPVKKQSENSVDMQGFLLIKYFGKHNH